MTSHPRIRMRALRHETRQLVAAGSERVAGRARPFLPPTVQIVLAALAGWAVVGVLFLGIVTLIEVLS